MNARDTRNGLAATRRLRAPLVGIAACSAALPFVAWPGAAFAWLLPVIIMLAEFTGGWIALAISSTLLVIVAWLVTSPVYPLMLTAVSALLCARLMRRGLPAVAPVVLLAAAGLANGVPGGDVVGTVPTPESVASALLAACFNVALATLFLVARPARAAWLPPLRRWRFEDALLLLVALAFLPLALASRGPGVAPSGIVGWLVAASIILALALVAAVGIGAGRVTRRLRRLLRDGRVRAARSRSSSLPREFAALFLEARQVSDGLQRRTAVQGLQLESARLRAGRLQQQVDSIERERRRMDLTMQQALGAADEVDRRWRCFLDAVPEALFITDPSGNIEYANEGVRQLLGHDPKALEKTRLTALLPGAQAGVESLQLAPELLDVDPEAAAIERTLSISDARGAPRQLSARVRVFRGPGVARLAIRLREPVGPMQRARDQFVATMSHEIRTPLHGLMATLDMLRSEGLSPEGSRRLSIARTSAKTLIRIANDILDLTRISVGTMPIERKPMSIDRLVSEVVDEARAREEAQRLYVHAVIGNSVPPAVLGDPLRIKQVLRNLVSNALKFTAAGNVTVSASWSRGISTIDVADTGTGIPVDRRASIFEAFVQADGASSRRHGGAGLGLSIGRQLSEAMGGNLALLDSGPRGSTFRLVLPLVATDEMPPDEQSQRNLRAVKGRILVAEDDEASRYVAQTLLESLGCPASIVANGTEALALMRAEEFDLALLDCEMPGLDGYEVTTRIRRAGGRHIPIIAMTASAMSSDRQRCFDAGMDDMLPKPFGKSALNEILVKWLASTAGTNAQAPMAKELAARPELDTEVFEELRQSLNWQVPPLRKIYASIPESAHKALGAMGTGAPPDVELALRRLHSLQGGAGLVGARQIEYLAARLLQALKHRRHPDIAEALPLLREALARFEKSIDVRLESLSG